MKKIEETRTILSILVAIQLLLTVYYFNSIFELSKTGVMSIPVFLAFLIGSICLYIGTIRVFLNKKSKGKMFFIALICLAISMFSIFQLPFTLTGYVEKLGMMLSICGWWLCREQNA